MQPGKSTLMRTQATGATGMLSHSRQSLRSMAAGHGRMEIRYLRQKRGMQEKTPATTRSKCRRQSRQSLRSTVMRTTQTERKLHRHAFRSTVLTMLQKLSALSTKLRRHAFRSMELTMLQKLSALSTKLCRHALRSMVCQAIHQQASGSRRCQPGTTPSTMRA